MVINQKIVLNSVRVNISVRQVALIEFNNRLK